MVMDLEGKTALITGSGRGIGAGIAMRLSRAGANVVINDIDADVAEKVSRSINERGGKAVAFPGDVTAKDFPQGFIDTAVNTHGGLDIIVNNAGYTWDNVIQKMGDEQFDKIMDLHVGAPFRLLRAAAEFFREKAKEEAAKGSTHHRKVVNISSTAGLYGNPGQANYSSAKSAMIGLTRTLCKEWGRYRVNVNCVAFGYIETRLTQVTEKNAKPIINVNGRQINIGIRKEMSQAASSMIPIGRPGTPEEAAGAVYLLCTPDADYISGQTIVCSGGATL